MSETAIYLAFCPVASNPELDFLAMRLHPEVKARLERFRNSEHRNQAILGRALLGVALLELGARLELRDLGYAPGGGPLMPLGYYGSISHTDGVVGAVASQTGPVGLDLEHRWHSFDVAETAFGREPCDHHHSDPCDCSVRAWVALEATAKAAARPLSEIQCSILRDREERLGITTWSVKTLALVDGMFAAIAASYPVLTVATVWFTPRELSNVLRRYTFTVSRGDDGARDQQSDQFCSN